MLREILKEASELYEKIRSEEIEANLTEHYEKGKANAVTLPFDEGETVYQYQWANSEIAELTIGKHSRVHWCRRRYSYADDVDAATLGRTKKEAVERFAEWLKTASEEEQKGAADDIESSLKYHRERLEEYELLANAIGQ